MPPKSAAVSKTDQRGVILYRHNWLGLTHFRTRRDHVRLRFAGSNCRCSVDCFCRAQSMNSKLWARAKRAPIRSQFTESEGRQVNGVRIFTLRNCSIVNGPVRRQHSRPDYNGPREEGKKMNLGPILFVVVLVALIVGLALCYVAGALIESLNNKPRMDPVSLRKL